MAEVYDYAAGFDDPSNKNAWFGNIIGEGRKVLEVGCATGYVGEHLVKQQRCRVYGVEYVERAAQKARERGCYEQVITGDIQDSATLSVLEANSFDFVLFGDVLEHLITPERGLANVLPYLTAGGHILICVPSIVHWSIRRDMLRGHFEYTDTGPLDRTHVHFFTPKTIRDLVRQAGLKIVRAGGVVWLPRFCYRLPQRIRHKLERLGAAVWPDGIYGQILLDTVKH